MRHILAIGILFTLLLCVMQTPSLAADGRAQHRAPQGDEDLRRWLENMVWHHRFTPEEVRAVTGMNADEIAAALKRFDIRADNRPPRAKDAPLLVLPYPGGRHPRIGFLDGAIDPQRETKVSVFTPWSETDYVVLDIPEAIWWKEGKQRELLYLAHTHIPTTWSKQGVEMKPLEWTRTDDGRLRVERKLPNGIDFGTLVTPARDAVHMEMWLTNGTEEPLTGLNVQACVMFKGAADFAQSTNDNKVLSKPYAACRAKDVDRWVITAWEPCDRVWGNPPCPCMHSDPKFPNCAPGKTVRLRGWLSFYEGKDLQAELQRIDATGWRKEE